MNTVKKVRLGYLAANGSTSVRLTIGCPDLLGNRQIMATGQDS